MTTLSRLMVALKQASLLAQMLDGTHPRAAFCRDDVTAWLDSCIWAVELEQARIAETECST
jgi:hypothetical protein